MARRRGLCDDKILSALLSSSSDEMLSDMSEDDSVHDKDYVQLSESISRSLHFVSDAAVR